MARHGWSGLTARIIVPDPNVSGATVNSEPMTIPEGAKTMTIFWPDGAGATYKIQGLKPTVDVDGLAVDSETWVDLTYMDIGNSTPGVAYALSGFAKNTALTIPVSVVGAPVIRFVSASSEAASAITVHITFNFDNI